MKRLFHTRQSPVAGRRDRLTYTAARWITADFRRFYNEHLTTDEPSEASSSSLLANIGPFWRAERGKNEAGSRCATGAKRRDS